MRKFLYTRSFFKSPIQIFSLADRAILSSDERSNTGYDLFVSPRGVIDFNEKSRATLSTNQTQH